MPTKIEAMLWLRSFFSDGRVLRRTPRNSTAAPQACNFKNLCSDDSDDQPPVGGRSIETDPCHRTRRLSSNAISIFASPLPVSTLTSKQYSLLFTSLPGVVHLPLAPNPSLSLTLSMPWPHKKGLSKLQVRQGLVNQHCLPQLLNTLLCSHTVIEKYLRMSLL